MYDDNNEFPEEREDTVSAEEPGEKTVVTQTAEEETPPEKKKKNTVGVVYDYVETFCFALAVMMVMFLFVFRYVSVDGDSMRETLHDRDKLIISNLFYTPKTGDIIVINPESHTAGEEPIIKRVIAVGGQTVLIDYQNWKVYVDGVELDEPYIEAMRSTYGSFSMHESNVAKYKHEFVVDEGKVFVMGDNRNNSTDSRDSRYGEIGVNRILGRVLFRIYPDFGGVE
ncbi:MAG: signal peptidase I [Clostridia bacterium]|nr:signal peptidase I [Clostridia bacterium]